jgi:hypothetical protein
LSQAFRDFLEANRADVSEFDPGAFRESGTEIRVKCVKAAKNG